MLGLEDERLERLRQQVVAAAIERADAVDRVRLRLAENDHRNIAVTRAASIQRGRVSQEDEIRSRPGVDDQEAVVGQMPLEKPARVGLRFGKE
jgi:hypothetical protein